MDVDWRDIADSLNLPQDRKLIKDTIRIFYSAFESNVDHNCDFTIKHLGRFKSSGRLQRAIKNHKHTKTKFYSRIAKRRQRLWAYKKLDDQWID